MPVEIRTSTRIAITIPDIDITITTTPAFAPYDSDTVRWAPREGGGWTIAWLADDDNVGGEDFWEDRDFGTFKEFDNQSDRDDFIAEMIAEHGIERVLVVDRYEHGLVHYSVRETVGYPDRRWDVAPAAVYVVPDDVPEDKRTEYANGTLDEYSSWCNGSVYGIVVRVVDADGNEIEDEAEECWGFIGLDYAQSEAGGAAKSGSL